jgi:hypothetical protein
MLAYSMNKSTRQLELLIPHRIVSHLNISYADISQLLDTAIQHPYTNALRIRIPIVRVRVRVRVTLQLTVSQSVGLGVEPKLGQSQSQSYFTTDGQSVCLGVEPN